VFVRQPRTTRPGEPDPLEQVLGREPTPEFAAQVAEECQRLLALLADRELEEVALAKMEGYTTEEIARRQGRTTRTVERKLRQIRHIWQADQPAGTARAPGRPEDNDQRCPAPARTRL
jgi:DNA-directed RNA polymerase specialized sigma24 family protein